MTGLEEVVLGELKGGPLTAGEVGRHLDMHVETVRQVLRALLAAGLITREYIPLMRGRGLPVYSYKAKA